jgi:hypothetical protein
MTPVRSIALAAALWYACIPGAAPLAQDLPGAGGGPPPLRMEELEIRGLLEKPDRLYVPAPGQIVFPLPTRYDLFREELARPVLLREIANDGTTNGGDRDSGHAGD